MIKRHFWINEIESAWAERSIVWLMGVRRVGKTSLCLSLNDIVYYDCERLQVRKTIENDYEAFLKKHEGQRVVFDEVHKLRNPSEVLKVAADHYPTVKIIATGSSPIEASKKFSDALTGRKYEVRLTPMLIEESALFGNPKIDHRLLHGGLPPFFLKKTLPEKAYEEWFSSYWAKDIQELFRLEKRASFLMFLELMMAQSGAVFVASSFAGPCEVSAKTIANYLQITKETLVAFVVKPFSRDPLTELRSTPKVYAFDTGFACYVHGKKVLKQEDYGVLWEHLVLNELVAYFSIDKIRYWRDKRGHEIDFIYLRKIKAAPDTIECKWSSESFNGNNLSFFRRKYPEGNNYLVAFDITKPAIKMFNGIRVQLTPLKDLPNFLKKT